MRRNFRQWMLELADGELIEAVVLGNHMWRDRKEDEPAPGSLLSWEEAAPYIDCPVDDCRAAYAWTASWVIAVATYDGYNWLYRIPRNPRACLPRLEGGG